jgi:hypothetical protein
MILSDDVSGDDSIDDGRECDGDNVERRVLKVMIIAALKWTLLTAVVIGQDKTKWGTIESSTHIRRRWQNILTKLPAVIGQAK